jgi:plasmid stability protein
MPTLHVRQVPDELYDRLRERAAAQNRSLSAEVIALLQHALGPDARSQRDVLASIRRRRSTTTVSAEAVDSATLLREDRRR